MYATVPLPACSSGVSPAAVREAVTAHQGHRAEGQGQREAQQPGGAASTLALLVVLSQRRTYYDYAHYLGKIAGRHLEGV